MFQGEYSPLQSTGARAIKYSPGAYKVFMERMVVKTLDRVGLI